MVRWHLYMAAFSETNQVLARPDDVVVAKRDRLEAAMRRYKAEATGRKIRIWRLVFRTRQSDLHATSHSDREAVKG